MSFIKKNRYTLIIVLMFILLVCLGIKVKDMLVPDEGKATYGNRLKSLEGHKISDSALESIDLKVREDKNVLDISHQVHGKIITLILTIDNKVTVDNAKKIGNSIIGLFDTEALTYYTVHVYLKKDDASLNNFPIEGYKDTESDSLVYSKDREISVSEDKTNES